MYVSSDQVSCPNGSIPLPPNFGVRNVQQAAVLDQQVQLANSNMTQLARRDWRAFRDMGPQVAWQVMNAPSGTPVYGADPEMAISPGAGSDGNITNPVPVQIDKSPKAAGSKTGSDGSGKPALTPDQMDFVKSFSFGQLFPWKTYLGPLPDQGTAQSLVYGGSPSNRSQVMGTSPVITPYAPAGYYQGSCPSPPAGVMMTPLGEPIYPDGGNGSAGGGSAADSGSGALIAILAVLGLAGLGWVANKTEQRKQRKAAK